MQGGTAEGTPQHQQILKIVSQSVRLWACQHVASKLMLLLLSCMEEGLLQSPEPQSSPRRMVLMVNRRSL